MENIRPRRSVLYMPGTNARALEKAKTLPADALILDLEDSVGPDEKEDARERVCAAVKEGGYGRREVVIRINALGSEWGAADISAAAVSGAAAVCVPKVQSADDVASIQNALGRAGAPSEMAIWPMMETPLAILNAREIAAAAAEKSPLSVLVMGTNDLAKETRAQLTADRLAMLAWLSHCVLAARACGLDVLDSVYNDFSDEEGLVRECRQAREMGMDGKTLIHPSQIESANAIFLPDPEEIEWARRIIAVFDEPQNQGKAVVRLDGKMVELLHREMALRTVAIADAVEVVAGE
jgi:citrate lyase subunit beta/citryl-CoA lyase